MNDGGEIAIVRDPCSLTSLPFAGEDEIGCDDRTAGTPAVPAPQVSASPPLQSCPIPKVLNLKGLHFLHANTRSLLPKIPEVRLLLSRTKTAVFAASET